MRLKPVPPAPGDLDELRTARRAVPLVPGSENDCCARLQERIDLPSRDVARTWLTFLRALGLAEEKTGGFARTRSDLERAVVAGRFRERVFGAREVLAVLESAGGLLTAEATFERVEHVVPRWERHRDPEWRDTWQERIERLLEWAVLFGLAERVDGGYGIVGDDQDAPTSREE